MKEYNIHTYININSPTKGVTHQLNLLPLTNIHLIFFSHNLRCKPKKIKYSNMNANEMMNWKTEKLTSWYALASAVSSISFWTSSRLISLCIALIALLPAFKLSKTAFCLLANSISDNWANNYIIAWTHISKEIKFWTWIQNNEGDNVIVNVKPENQT